MTADIRVFRCLEDNIGALLHDPATGACAAIDAPDEVPIITALEETGWKLTDILVTHRHADHIQGIAPLKRRFGCRVVAPEKAGPQVPLADSFVREGDQVRVGSLSAEVWETPGHCIDHVTYWFAGEQAVFAGDTLFTLGCGRVMESPTETMWTSLSRFTGLPGDARVYSGHDYVLSNGRFALAAEPDNAALQARMKEAERARDEGRFLVPSTMAEERRTNPFLRAGEPALARGVGLDPGTDAATVFKALREWKNHF